ncbi:hypothetical protein EVAR_91636_1 [Eumeta japonica]|uniref:Uncharacterized protein n=1 Tax=Eumeta variegata TaxID=151549 RepID=A0A4C2A0U9_EUMVA|nr:hypothetical protein EVAR_91636_1 [Eumeta japonica]
MYTQVCDHNRSWILTTPEELLVSYPEDKVSHTMTGGALLPEPLSWRAAPFLGGTGAGAQKWAFHEPCRLR